MRLIAISLLLSSCATAYDRVDQSYQPFLGDHVDIRRFGYWALDMSVDAQGNGRFRINEYPRIEVGTFKLSAEEYAQFRQRLDAFRNEAKHLNPATLEPLTNICSDGSKAISDSGGIVVRWEERGTDDYLQVKLGCPMASTKARDDELWAFVRGYWDAFKRNIEETRKR